MPKHRKHKKTLWGKKKKITSFSFKGIVWKTLIDEINSILVCELRDEETRTVGFQAIDLAKKKILWDHMPLQEDWWIGLDEVFNSKLILHGFKDLQNPEHKGIIVCNVHSGKILWQNDSITFEGIHQNTIIGYLNNEGEKSFVKVDIENGQVEPIALNSSGVSFKSRETAILNCHHILASQELFTKISQFIKDLIKIEPVVAIDYLEKDNYIIISYYIVENKTLSNYILILDENGEEKVHQNLGKNLKGIASDTFFVFKNMVIFVLEKKELVVYELE